MAKTLKIIAIILVLLLLAVTVIYAVMEHQWHGELTTDYSGYVYDDSLQMPIEGVAVTEIHSSISATTDAKGYFVITYASVPEDNMLDVFAFQKEGYITDSLPSIGTHPESQYRLLKGETVYLKRK